MFCSADRKSADEDNRKLNRQTGAPAFEVCSATNGQRRSRARANAYESCLAISLTSWDFSEIPVFSPDRPKRVHPVDTALPSAGAETGKARYLDGSAIRLSMRRIVLADQVMCMSGPAFTAISAGSAQINRKCALCQAAEEKKEEKVQKKTIYCVPRRGWRGAGHSA